MGIVGILVPRTVNPYLQRLSTLLNQNLAGILRSTTDKAEALKKAEETLQRHFSLVFDFSQRRTLPRGKKLVGSERSEVVGLWVKQALADFEKIFDDRSKSVQTT